MGIAVYNSNKQKPHKSRRHKMTLTLAKIIFVATLGSFFVFYMIKDFLMVII